MRLIGILYNPLSERSVRLSGKIESWLRGMDLEVWRGTSEEGRNQLDQFEHMWLLVALGGDGTTLRAARLAIPLNIPVLTVAAGNINFMAELSANELPDALQTLLNGGGWYEERTLLCVTVHRCEQQIAQLVGLNDAVLSRGDVGRTLTVDVQIDDLPLTTYRADGVIVAPATGSTAYALSAGGPIMDPRLRSMVLVPVAAHLTAVPALIVHEDTSVRLLARSSHQYYHAMLTVDGHNSIDLEQGDEVMVRRSEQVCRFARVQSPAQFYASFVKRLQRV